MAAHDDVLYIQDTTAFDSMGSGLGSLSCEAQRDMYPNPTYTVSTSRELFEKGSCCQSVLRVRSAASMRFKFFLDLKRKLSFVLGHLIRLLRYLFYHPEAANPFKAGFDIEKFRHLNFAR